ncbi:MAG TPA: TonB-dependent receptor plug domain-containing protein [Bacteroidia bacterium]|nr:TonB-dependent receptor plug domain-containing protein [Bacteroidia bacterium]
MNLRGLFTSLLILVCLSGFESQAQQARIYGTVKDSLNKPVYGATVAVFGQPIGVTTADNGSYSLIIPANESLKIVFSYTGLRADTVLVKLNPGEERNIDRKLRDRIIGLGTVEIQERSLKSLNLIRIDPKVVSVIPTPNQSVEDLLKTMPGVASANELSSSYSVRGGNYDENLVYINDFEVYRPLLVRSGQQEGLSIINPDMVESIQFSAGGFDAVYGDKLSSVLDIKYRKPKKFAGSLSASMLGGSLELENRSKNKKWYYLAGLRQKSNQYLLNTFDTKGEYKPSFTDVQLLTGFDFNEKFSLEIFGNYARNRYNLVPQTRETNFGTINDAKRFTVYFEGQEIDRYQTFTGSFSATYRPADNVKLKLLAGTYHTREEENFDILGQYFLDQLENDFGKDDFGDVAFNLGVGSFLNHARNRLEATVYNAEHKGEIVREKMLWQWGVKVQHEEIEDKLHEWYYNDSAGFSIPSTRDSINPMITLNDVVIAKSVLSSNRISGYLQNTWELLEKNRLILNLGIRANYWDLNEELVISPRGSVTFKPNPKKSLNFRAAGGYFYQPPFYRELRDLDGNLHPETKAQQSIHGVVGADFTFLALGREFKLTSELFYKSLDRLIPYKVDNLRLRYLPDMKSKGYARGIDFRLFGEFVPGAESWASLSILQTEEDIQDDFYYIRYNSSGEEIIPGYTYDNIAVDSTRIEPGYLPRPADQRVSFGLFFQDYLPKFPTYKMSLTLLFGTALPFGPPGHDRYKDVLRTPTYRRVDIGFSKQLIGDEVKRKPKSKFLGNLESLWIGVEVFNLLQVSNVASYNWITDISNARKYAIPNYLTARQLNIRLNAKF